MQDPGLKMFLFFSELLGRSVIDSEGKSLGKLVDLKVKMGELFPMVVTLRIRKRGAKAPLFFILPLPLIPREGGSGG